MTMDRWTLTLIGLRGLPWPALPVLPGRVHSLADDDDEPDLPAFARLPAAELARREGITTYAAHARIRKARLQAAADAAESEA